jgi:lipoprotein-anchoring transpeptidase ErfK/SrfK
MRHGPLPRLLAALTAVLAALLLLAGAAEARANADAGQSRITIEIDKSTQRMTVRVDGEARYVFRVSTGRAGHETPRGSYRPSSMAEMAISRKYGNTPMPHSIFFTRVGHAIHATAAVRNLGRPASHGCVRLSPQDARALYELVERVGMRNVAIRITGAEPGARA